MLKIGKGLIEYYYDTAQSFHPSVLRCTIELVSLEHVLFGTDCPYTSIDLRAKKTIENIENCGFSNDEKEKIYSKNAIELFPEIKEKLSRA